MRLFHLNEKVKCTYSRYCTLLIRVQIFFSKYQASGQALELVCTARDSLYILSAL